jgi:hypothetical protein
MRLVDGSVLARDCTLGEAECPAEPLSEEARVLPSDESEEGNPSDEERRHCERHEQNAQKIRTFGSQPSRPTSRQPAGSGMSSALSTVFHALVVPGGLADTRTLRSWMRPVMTCESAEGPTRQAP